MVLEFSGRILMLDSQSLHCILSQFRCFSHSMWALIYSIYSHNLFVAAFKCRLPQDVWKSEMTAPLKSLSWHCTEAPLIFTEQTIRSHQRTCAYFEFFEVLWSVCCSAQYCSLVPLLNLTVEWSAQGEEGHQYNGHTASPTPKKLH